MTPEAKVKKEVRSILKSLGAYYTQTVTGGFGKSGASDFQVCLPVRMDEERLGLFVSIECKAKGGRLTPLQLQHLEHVVVAGGRAIVVDETGTGMMRMLLDAWLTNPPKATSSIFWCCSDSIFRGVERVVADTPDHD